MIKMFTTQLVGLINEFNDKETEGLEDGARILAQALIGEGSIFIHGIGEMNAVAEEALKGKERWSRSLPLIENDKRANWTVADRVLLFSRDSSDQTAITLAKQLQEEGATVVGVSTVTGEDEDLSTFVDVHINLGVTRSLVPNDHGERIGFPSTLLALFAYQCLYLTVHEILDEY